MRADVFARSPTPAPPGLYCCRALFPFPLYGRGWFFLSHISFLDVGQRVFPVGEIRPTAALLLGRLLWKIRGSYTNARIPYDQLTQSETVIFDKLVGDVAHGPTPQRLKGAAGVQPPPHLAHFDPQPLHVRCASGTLVGPPAAAAPRSPLFLCARPIGGDFVPAGQFRLAALMR